MSKGGKLIVPQHAPRPVPRLSPQVHALLNHCWSEARMSVSPSTRVMFLPIEMVMKMHVLQWLAMRGRRPREGE